MKKYIFYIIINFVILNAFSQSEKPNIVLIFIDDYGYMDIEYRNKIFHTPHLNELKTQSLEFLRAYIPTPTCSPSRASLLTGKEAVRMEMVRHIHIPENTPNAKYSYWPTDPAQMPSINYLPLEEITYAERLKEYGYYNMFIGKWHLGGKGKFPVDQGFDDEYGATNAGHPQNYYYPFFNEKNTPDEFKQLDKPDYLTDILTNKAVDFITNYSKATPFMLSFWYYSVHTPSVGRKDLMKRSDSLGLKGKYAHHVAMVSAVDESIGKVRAALNEKGIADNTIIIVLSDQGGAYGNTPLRGGKIGGDTLAEGGARVPFMIYYPGITRPNTTCSIPIQSIDLYPTLLEIASGKTCKDKQINGVSLIPLLNNKKIKKRNLFFYRSYEDQYAAILCNEWKLIKYRSGKFQLYNIDKDISESNNLIGTGLKIEYKLKRKLFRWEKEAVHL